MTLYIGMEFEWRAKIIYTRYRIIWLTKKKNGWTAVHVSRQGYYGGSTAIHLPDVILWKHDICRQLREGPYKIISFTCQGFSL